MYISVYLFVFVFVDVIGLNLGFLT